MWVEKRQKKLIRTESLGGRDVTLQISMFGLRSEKGFAPVKRLESWLRGPIQQKMANDSQGPLFSQAKLCQYLVDHVDSSSGLEIRPSLIPGAGSALFTETNVADGTEIFRSQPLVSVVLDRAQSVCEYCFRDGDSRVHPDGRFRSRHDPPEMFLACEGCGISRYCSEVSWSIFTRTIEARPLTTVSIYGSCAVSVLSRPSMNVSASLSPRMRTCRPKSERFAVFCGRGNMVYCQKRCGKS